MRRASFAVLLALLSSLAAPATLLADSPTNGTIIVLGDHVLPGQPFSITGFDIDPGIELELAITNGSRTASLGRATVGIDGTVNASVTLADDFPLGYANVTATSPADGQWTTAVLVGDRAEGPGAPVGDGVPIDERSVGLLLVVIGLVVFAVAAFVFLRGRPRRSADPD